MENREEIERLIRLIAYKTEESYKNLESIGTGFHYKTKAEITESVMDSARRDRRINAVLHDCLQVLLEGGTIDDYYNIKLNSATRTNQCKQDRLDSMEELEFFTELILELRS